jgi:hypothetical protein
MRIEYENHEILPSGAVLLWVDEWTAEQGGLPTRVSYVFIGGRVRRWMDSRKEMIQLLDPRHLRLLELMQARFVEDEIDQLVGL